MEYCRRFKNYKNKWTNKNHFPEGDPADDWRNIYLSELAINSKSPFPCCIKDHIDKQGMHENSA